MLYLLYVRKGFIKKFPLDKNIIFFGRSTSNDFYLNESFISSKHAKINVFKDHIVIEDTNSTNGIFIQSTKIRKATIKLNQWFRIGYIKFFLKKGNPQELVLSEKVRPVLNKISNIIAPREDETQEAISLLYSEPLVEMLQIGFKLQESIDLFKHAKKLLSDTLKKGCLLLLSKIENRIKIESEWNYEKKYQPFVNQILKFEDFFQRAFINDTSINLNSLYFCSFPIILSNRNKQLVLLYMVQTDTDISISEQTVYFLEDLSVEISIIHSLIEQNRETKTVTGEIQIPEIITINQQMLNLLLKCEKIAESDLFVILEGETGTGKELLAKFIHYKSKRSAGNFVALNCAAIPENLMENEIFGHEKGAFTDARSLRIGKLELSSGGTLVLDEIGDMPLSLQKKILRVIQEGYFSRLGGNQLIKVDLRIICLTHKNIKELVSKKILREDLYYRIAHVTLSIPPLKERKEDIVPLVNHFVKIFSINNQINIRGASKELIKALEMYDWPGNIRELENEIKKIIAISENGDIIDLDSLKDEIITLYKEHGPVIPESGESEKKRILMLLEKYKWNKTSVAKELKISRTALYEKLKKYKI